ncbi:MAG: polysaccharide biosynthesis protein [Alphaproteobacteria bacterium]
MTRGKIIFLHDLFMAFISLPIALYLRVGNNFFNHFNENYVLYLSLGYAILAGIIFHFMRMYWGIWRFASLNDLLTIIKAVTILQISFVILLFLVNRVDSYPRSAIIINWFVLCALLGSPRFFYRILKDKRYELLYEKNIENKIPVLLYGLGSETDWFIRAMQSGAVENYRALGIIAKKQRVGQQVRGIEVLGTEEDIKDVIAKLAKKNLAPQKLILTREDLDGKKINELFELASANGMTLARIPKADNLRSGINEKIDIKPVAIEDLLQRPQKVLDKESMRSLIHNRRVLITGAGGSIGSELTRQIAGFEPSEMTLLENSEFNLYNIDMEMSEKFSHIKKNPVIADVRNKKHIELIFAERTPELVFHAAALKHVPMTEINPLTGILTNTLGTKIVADACDKFGIKVMVMISTDKAVNPTNVMGATKRLAECYCQALDIKNSLSDDFNATRYVTVRFGNVLGSTGSVIPLFQRQLENGMPLTVTHPDITRYFMTIKEAVELVLQASVLGARHRQKQENEPEYNGKIFVLEMGEAVKISDLAKQMIKLAGLRPDIDVEIRYTGLRPGEKMYEELFYNSESLLKTPCKDILLAEPRIVDLKMLAKELEKVEKFCINGETLKALDTLHSLVPEFEKQK